MWKPLMYECVCGCPDAWHAIAVPASIQSPSAFCINPLCPTRCRTFESRLSSLLGRPPTYADLTKLETIHVATVTALSPRRLSKLLETA